MSDLDFTLCSIPMLLSRNKSEAYQRQVVDRYTAIMKFLWAKKLAVSEAECNTTLLS